MNFRNLAYQNKSSVDASLGHLEKESIYADGIECLDYVVYATRTGHKISPFKKKLTDFHDR